VASDKLYDRHKRDKEARRFYKSTAWKKARQLALQRDKHLCARHLKNKQIVPADVVHHIKELRYHPNLALDLDNLECLCHRCHTRLHKTKSNQEEKISISYVSDGANEEMI